MIRNTTFGVTSLKIISIVSLAVLQKLVLLRQLVRINYSNLLSGGYLTSRHRIPFNILEIFRADIRNKWNNGRKFYRKQVCLGAKVRHN